MLSEDFFRCFQIALKLTPEELGAHFNLVSDLLKSKGVHLPSANESLDFPDMVKKSMDLLHSKMDLMGWEMALLAGMILQHGNFSDSPVPLESFESRGITGELRRYPNRSIANITSVMDALKERSFVDETEAREKGAHRSYRVNSKGYAEVMKIWKRHEQLSGAA